MPTAALEGLAHRIRFLNPALCRLTGKNRDELMGLPFPEALPEPEPNQSRALLDRVFETGATEILLDQEHRGDSPTPAFWSYTAWAVLDERQCPTGVMVQVNDTTQAVLVRQASEALNQALLVSGLKQHELTQEADELNARLRRAMTETHHRVKNNLQVVVALVEMQMGEGESVADAALQRIHQHLRTLATVHELLTEQAKEDHSVTHIGAKVVLERLVGLLQQTSGARTIRASLSDLVLPTQKVAALCLLVSECVSNALKYARGEIEITLQGLGDRARLEVCDDGAGFPAGFDPDRAAHTGMELIESLARFDLRGEVRYENHPRGGGRIVVTFPILTQA